MPRGVPGIGRSLGSARRRFRTASTGGAVCRGCRIAGAGAGCGAAAAALASASARCSAPGALRSRMWQWWTLDALGFAYFLFGKWFGRHYDQTPSVCPSFRKRTSGLARSRNSQNQRVGKPPNRSASSNRGRLISGQTTCGTRQSCFNRTGSEAILRNPWHPQPWRGQKVPLCMLNSSCSRYSSKTHQKQKPFPLPFRSSCALQEECALGSFSLGGHHEEPREPTACQRTAAPAWPRLRVGPQA